MNENTFLLLLVAIWIALLIPLLVSAGKKTKPTAIIVCGLLLGPIIGWILYLILDDAKGKQTPGQARALQKLQGIHSEDPLEAWERQERAAAGPPPPPPSYKQQTPSA